jgi:hypothetical protein
VIALRQAGRDAQVRANEYILPVGELELASHRTCGKPY